MTMRLAYLCCRETVSTSPVRRADAFEHDHSIRILGSALARRDVTMSEIVWDDPDTDWRDFDGAVIGTTWDYHERPAAFLRRIADIETLLPVANDPRVVEWNLRKTYLKALEANGAPSIPTLWHDGLDHVAPGAIHDALDADRIVLKPVVGATASGQYLLRRGEAPPPGDPLWTTPFMAQPFLDSINTEGELSFLFFGGRFSHALRKAPAPGDYRVQSVFDGTEHGLDPPQADIDAARRVLAAVPFETLYARIDLIRLDSGALAVMECELIEPYLFPLFDPSEGDLFAEEVVNWFDRPRPGSPRNVATRTDPNPV